MRPRWFSRRPSCGGIALALKGSGVGNREIIDITTGGVLGWAVFAPTTGTPVGALAGEYVGASGDIGIIPGVETNILISGTGRTFALQPVSLGGSVTVNVARGISVLKLRPVP